MTISTWSLAMILGAAPVASLRSFIDKPNLPGNVELEDESNNWVSLDEKTEYLQVLDGRAARRLESSSTGGSSAVNPYATQAFVDGEYEYDEYQQAWRYLGFIIDCDSSNDDDDGSGSYDGGTGEGCSRYVVWAAYVDLEYEGGGIGEYQYFDTDTQQWDATSCNYGEAGSGDGDGDDGDRCAKMDCHLENTHFSLLGVFKHKSYDDWMEQLFKHEGMCVWTSTEYSFMGNARKAWPQGCTPSYTTMKNGDPIYYDLKPTTGGGMRIGLYTDTRCVEEYHSSGRNDPITVENVVGNLLMEGGSGDSGSGDYSDDGGMYDSLDKAYSAWDSALEKFKVCQPCVAHDLTNVGYNTDDDASKGSGYWTYNSRYDDDAYYDDQYQYNGDDGGGGDYSDFDCYDDAGYTNVNQCMKFMAKTTMNAATYRDLSLALQQGTTTDFQLTALSTKGQSKWLAVSSNTGLKSFVTILFFMFSSFLLVFGLLFFRKARRESNFNMPSFSLKQPLVLT